MVERVVAYGGSLAALVIPFSLLIDHVFKITETVVTWSISSENGMIIRRQKCAVRDVWAPFNG